MIYSGAQQIQNKRVKSRNTYEHKDWEIQREGANTWDPINCDQLNPAEQITDLRLPINLWLMKQRVPEPINTQQFIKLNSIKISNVVVFDCF